MESHILCTDADLVLLRIFLSPDKELIFDSDLYIYRPAGDGGPSLTLLKRPPGDRIFQAAQVGLLSSHSHTNRRDDDDDISGLSLSDKPYYMVAALCDNREELRLYHDELLESGQYLLYLYDSKLGSWTTHIVSLEDEQLHKHQEDGYFLHDTDKVIAIGGEEGNMGFVDLWRGILICDLLLVRDSPRLQYIEVPLPLHPRARIQGDGRLCRDIAVMEDRIRFVQQQIFWKPCPLYVGQYIVDGWMAATWSRLIASPVEDPWERQHTIRSSEMDISNPEFELLPKLHDNAGRPLPPFKELSICQPTLSLKAGDATVCFMIKIDIEDDEAWVIDVDMSDNKLQGVAGFDATRSV